MSDIFFDVYLLASRIRLHLPYVARSDTYRELDKVVYDGNNKRLTEQERLQLQAQLNNGNPNPPANGRIENNF